VNLEKLYEQSGVKDEIDHPGRPILFVVPDESYDISQYLTELGIDRFEVNVTWPKQDDDFSREEIRLCDSNLVIQVGGAILSRKYPVISDGTFRPSLHEKVRKAIGDRFVNLHHHDEFSIRDGLGTVGGLVKQLQKRKQSFCSVTNHGHVGGWIKQYGICRKAGIKPIFGFEAYCNEYRGDDVEERKSHRRNFHLVMLARNEVGFYNLIKIHNDAQLHGFYYRPRVNKEAMKRWGEGIISSSACMGGELAVLLMDDKKDEARRVYDFYNEAFDEFYIELTLIEMQVQIEVTHRLIEFAREVGAPLIVSCDSHYLLPEHTATHDILLLIKSGKTIDDKIENPEEVWQFEAKNLYYRSEAEMRQLWGDGIFSDVTTGRALAYRSDVFTEEVLNEAFENTRLIAMKCEEIVLDSEFKLPKLFDDSSSVLRGKAKAGFKAKNLRGKQYSDRLNFELEVICNLGFADYFLAMDRIISDTKEKFGEGCVGWGRGSAAGSIVSWCLGLTDLDPIKYGLLFERFLDYGRMGEKFCSFGV